MKDIWFTVYGTFSPEPKTFEDEAKALVYAKESVNDWAQDVSVVKSETIWRSNEPARV